MRRLLIAAALAMCAMNAIASERPYTASEIDALRTAVELKWLFGTPCLDVRNTTSAMSRSYREEEKAVAVEQMVRTYMQAGITADNLYEQCKKP